jgi:chemotaxis-related protein WspD
MNNQVGKVLSADFLLDRTPDQDYIEEWTQFIQKEQTTQTNPTELSVVMFRLNEEWFAMNTLVVAEVAVLRQYHRIPHRSSSFLLGFVNLRGQFFICVSLYHLLAISCPATPQINKQTGQCQRLLALKKEEMKFTFHVDEVFGVYHCNFSMLEAPPVTLSKSSDNYLKGMFSWRNYNVGLLDETLIFQNLQRRICERK